MLIKLTGVVHPDLNGGRPAPVYIDPSRVLVIAVSTQRFSKTGSFERNQELYGRLRLSAEKLAEAVNGYMPKMDDPVAVEWLRTAQMAAHSVSEASRAWYSATGQQDYHDPIDCTEISLACGTALEHGVMLSRVWVSESPEEVAALLAGSQDAQTPGNRRFHPGLD